MRKTILEISNSLTASNSTEMLCMMISEGDDTPNKMYFVEYPTNLPPNHNNLNVRGNTVKELTYWEFLKVKEALKSYQDNIGKYTFLHAPTYMVAYLAPLVNLELFD